MQLEGLEHVAQFLGRPLPDVVSVCRGSVHRTPLLLPNYNKKHVSGSGVGFSFSDGPHAHCVNLRTARHLIAESRKGIGRLAPSVPREVSSIKHQLS